MMRSMTIKKCKVVTIVCLCCVFLIMTSIDIALAFSTNPIVHYNGRTKEITLMNTRQTDLFHNFKDVIPGDTITQIIQLHGENIQTMTDVYLRMEHMDEKEVPKGVILKVYAKDKMISATSLNNDDIGTEGIHLHRFEESDFIDLKVVLEVPVSIGNEIADLQKELCWTFTVLEDGTVIPPKTGDAGFPIGSVVVNICSLTIIIWIFINRRDEIFK